MPMSRITRKTNRRSICRRRKSKFSKKPSVAFTSAVRKVINRTAEKKYYSFTSGPADITNTGLLLRLTEVAQGDTDVTRDGDQLTIRSLQFNFTLATGDATNFMRVIIFQWFDSTATVPTYPVLTDILLDPSQPWISPYSHDHRYQFRILYDRTHTLDTSNVPVKNVKVFLKRFPGKHRKIQFVGASTTNYVNGLFAFVVSDSTAVVHPKLSYSGKFNFSDV